MQSNGTKTAPVKRTRNRCAKSQEVVTGFGGAIDSPSKAALTCGAVAYDLIFNDMSPRRGAVIAFNLDKLIRGAECALYAEHVRERAAVSSDESDDHIVAIQRHVNALAASQAD